jgi:hypothetical protein
VWGVETVSASFGKQVVSSSLKAIGAALLLILAYVTIRFQWKFALSAIAEPAAEGAAAGADGAAGSRPAGPRRKSTGKRKKRR